MPASTIGGVLARAGMPRLPDVNRRTGELLRGRRHSNRRYERQAPGDLLHVDVKKPGRVPAGGDHTRLASAAALPDKRTATCADVLRRAAAWFAARGVTVARVLTDNAAPP